MVHVHLRDEQVTIFQPLNVTLNANTSGVNNYNSENTNSVEMLLQSHKRNKYIKRQHFHFIRRTDSG